MGLYGRSLSAGHSLGEGQELRLRGLGNGAERGQFGRRQEREDRFGVTMRQLGLWGGTGMLSWAGENTRGGESDAV